MERMRPEEFRQWLEQRTRRFAVCVFRFLDALPHTVSSKVISNQLGKSASSVGANYREANRAESRDDFIHKVTIALKESAESVYWLEILGDLRPDDLTVGELKAESVELRNLLQSILVSTKKSRIPNPESQIPNPKSQILNLKSQILNPKS